MPTMNSATANGAPYQVPPEPSRWPSIALAAAVHAGLLAFLYIGVNWQNTVPVQVEAEVWDMKTQSAAPPPPPPPEVVEPQPQPVPVPKVVQPPPPRVEEPVAPKPPDIALEREKRKAEKRKELEEEKKLEDQKLARELKAKQLADKKEQELADKKAAQKEEELAKKLEEKKLADKLKADKLAKAKEAADDQKRLDKVRADEMRRITAGAGTSGEAAKSTASRVDTSYLAAINSKIKSSTSYAGSTEVPGKPEVVFKIEQLPSGEIISVRLVKSSGIPAFDDAVEKGILKSSPLPKNKNGTVLRTLEIAFAMKDLK